MTCREYMELRHAAEELAAFKGRLDPTEMVKAGHPSRIVGKLKESVDKLRAAELFAQKNPLGAFLSGKPEDVDRALAVITKPGSTAVTQAVHDTLTPNSKEWWAVRKYALEDLLSNIFRPTKSLGKTVYGKAVKDKLATYTAKQRELLFPAGLDEDLQLFANEAQFLFPHFETEDLGTSIAAAGIKSKLWFNTKALKQYAFYNVANWLANRPIVFRYLTDEIRNDPVRARGVLGAVGQLILSREIDGGQPEGAMQPAVPVPPASEIPQTDQETPFEERYGGTSD